MLFELCGTTCQHNSVTSKMIIKMLHYMVFCFFFSQKQTAQFFGITLQLCGIVCEDKQDEHPRSAPAGVLACNLHSSCRGAASAGGKVEKKHLKLAELGSVQLCSFQGVERVMMRITRESSAVIVEKGDPDPEILLVFLDAFKGLAVGLSADGVRAAR